MVDAIIAVGRHLPGLSAARLTVLWYLVPIAGGVSWITLGRWGASSRAARVVAIVAAVITAGSVAAIGALAGLRKLGLGTWLALAGALVLGSSVIAPRRTRSDSSVRMAGPGR